VTATSSLAWRFLLEDFLSIFASLPSCKVAFFGLASGYRLAESCSLLPVTIVAFFLNDPPFLVYKGVYFLISFSEVLLLNLACLASFSSVFFFIFFFFCETLKYNLQL